MCIVACILVTIILIYINSGNVESVIALLCFIICFALTNSTVTGGQKSDLVTYTLGPFKRMPGAWTTMGESACRAAIYLETGHLLPTATGRDVPWLRYKNVNLELDGYDATAKLAFEYDGPQHHRWTAWYDMIPERRRSRNESGLVLDFYRSRFYDRLKTELCKKHGVRLIRISAPVHKLRAHVRAALAGNIRETPTDDMKFISQFTSIDTRDSTSYERVQHGEFELVIPNLEWSPHPYHLDDKSLYRRAWHNDLVRFLDSARSADVKQKIITQLKKLTGDPKQIADIIYALEHGY